MDILRLVMWNLSFITSELKKIDDDEIVISELKELYLMEALKLWRISFNAGIERRKEQRSLEKLK